MSSRSFRDLFSDTESEAQALMQQFLRTEHHGAKILFLSATPYKMLTIKGDDPEQGDHQEDFLAAIRMLHGGGEVGNTAAKELKAEMRLFRESLRCYAQGLPNEAAEKRNQVEDRLRGVMSRQERVAATSTDAGLSREEITADIRAEDLRQALAVDRVARQVGGHNRADYWKSAPYLFSFMPGEFDLARKIAGYDKRADLASTARPALFIKTPDP